MIKNLIIFIIPTVLAISAVVFVYLKSKPQTATPIPTPITLTTPQPTINPQVTNNINEKKDVKGVDTMLNKPEMQLKDNVDYQAVLSTTKGSITIDLFEDKTPITVNNFVYLANQGFYENTIFHRVISGFMIQGGDPTGTGAGSPGYRFDDEPFDGEYERGTVAMANAGPNTNGSQFFIMHANYNLPKNYVIFGKVIEGLEVVDAIATAQTTTSPSGENSKPIDPVTVQKVEIIEK